MYRYSDLAPSWGISIRIAQKVDQHLDDAVAVSVYHGDHGPQVDLERQAPLLDRLGQALADLVHDPRQFDGFRF